MFLCNSASHVNDGIPAYFLVYNGHVSATRKDCRSLKNAANFVLHLETKGGGYCTASPSEGRVYATLFGIHCYAFYGREASINYRYFMNNTSNSSGWFAYYGFLSMYHTVH